jgi:hypothetical protein
MTSTTRITIALAILALAVPAASATLIRDNGAPTSSLAGTASSQRPTEAQAFPGLAQQARDITWAGAGRATLAQPQNGSNDDDGSWLVLGLGIAGAGIAAAATRQYRVRARRVTP